MPARSSWAAVSKKRRHAAFAMVVGCLQKQRALCLHSSSSNGNKAWPWRQIAARFCRHKPPQGCGVTFVSDQACLVRLSARATGGVPAFTYQLVGGRTGGAATSRILLASNGISPPTTGIQPHRLFSMAQFADLGGRRRRWRRASAARVGAADAVDVSRHVGRSYDMRHLEIAACGDIGRHQYLGFWHNPARAGVRAGFWLCCRGMAIFPISLPIAPNRAVKDDRQPTTCFRDTGQVACRPD